MITIAHVWRGILDKIVIRSRAVRHYIVVRGYVAGDTIYIAPGAHYPGNGLLIVPDMLSYRNGDAIMSYHMLLYRTR